MHPTKRIFYIVNADWFFLSHRLPLALDAKKNGFEVYILTKNTGLKNEIEQQGLQFIEINFDRSGTNPVKDALVILKLRKIIKKYHPNLIHNVSIKPSIYGSIAAKLSNSDTKIINAVSGLGYNFINERKGLTQRVLNLLLRFAYHSGVVFIFQNEDDRNFYKNRGLLKKNKHVIIRGSGVDTNQYSYTPPIEKEKLHVVLTARMLYDKGIIEFIDAAKQLKEKWYNKVLFVLVGGIDTINKAAISQRELEKQLDPGYIKWVGFQKEVSQYLVNSDIYCLLSYREGLPKSILEAMAIGRPIITTNAPGCKECVDNGVNGFLVPLKNSSEAAISIDKLLENKQLREDMGVKSNEKVIAEFSLDKVMSSVRNLYQSLL